MFVLSWTGWKREEAVIFISPVARLPFNRVWDSTICCCFQLSRLIIRRPEVLQPFKNMFCAKKVWMNPARFCRQPFSFSSPVYFLRCQRGGKCQKSVWGERRKRIAIRPESLIFHGSAAASLSGEKKLFSKFLEFLVIFFLGKGYLCHFRTRDPVNDREELNSVEVNYPFWWRH